MSADIPGRLDHPMTVGQLKNALAALPDDAIMYYIEIDEADAISRALFLRTLVVNHRHPGKVRLEIGATTRDEDWRRLRYEDTAQSDVPAIPITAEVLRHESLPEGSDVLEHYFGGDAA